MDRFGDPTRWMLAGLLVVAGLLYLVLPRPPRGTTTDEQGVQRTIITVIGGAFERDRQMWQAIEAGFERDHPEIDLQVMRGGGTQRKIDTMIAGGVAPDILEVQWEQVQHYMDAGALLDLAPFVAADPDLQRDIHGYTDHTGRRHPPDFFEFAMEAFREGGHQYALPGWYINFFFFYNRTLFDKYNVPYPDDEWDWQGLRERAIALTRDRAGRPIRIPRRHPDGRLVTDAQGWVVYRDNPEAAAIPHDFGFTFATWQHGPENFVRQNGGSFFADVGQPTERVEIGPATLDALWYLYEVALVNRTQPNEFVAPGATQDAAFRAGRVAMLGPVNVSVLLDARDRYNEFAWDVAPLPKGPDGTRAALVSPTGLGVSSQSRNPDAAFTFVKWFSSQRGAAVLSRWPLFVPPRRSVALSEEYFLEPGAKPDSKWAMVHDVSYPYTDPRTGESQIGYTVLPGAASIRAGDVLGAISQGTSELYYFGRFTRDHFDRFQRAHQRPPTEEEALDLHRAAFAEGVAQIGDHAEKAYRWARTYASTGRTATTYGAWQLWLPLVGVLVVASGLFVWRMLRHPIRLGPLERSQQRWGYLLVSPWLVGFLCLTAGPMLFSIGLSFCQWESLGSLRDAEFIGLENYKRALLGDDPLFYTSLRATLQYTVLAVPLTVIGGLTLALLMNSKVPGINLWRTFYFVPSILPVVAVVVLYFYLFNPNQGWVNHALRFLGWENPPAWLTSDQKLLFIPAPMWMFILMHLWAVGGSMIIYLGALQGIPTQLYEAAEVDGANRWRRFWNVTLPMISPVLFFMLIMGIIGSFQVFTNAYVLFESGGGPNNSTLFYVLHLFNEAVNRYRFGYGAALAWILFLIILVFTALIFKSSPLWVYYEGQRERRNAAAPAPLAPAAPTTPGGRP